MPPARKKDAADDQMMLSGFDDVDEVPRDPQPSHPAETKEKTASEPGSIPPEEPAKTDSANAAGKKTQPPAPPTAKSTDDHVAESPPAVAIPAPKSSRESEGRKGQESKEARRERHKAVGISDESLPAILRHEIAETIDEPVPDLNGKRVVVIDSHSLIYQVFYALPPMTSQSGLPVNAVYGFVGDVLELIQRKDPDYVIAAFDKSEITFRNDLFPQYKANRDSMPDELRQQIPLIRQAIDCMGVAIIEQAGFEADDLLATVAAKVEQAGGECLVVTSDKDCRQLISEQTKIYNIRKDEELDADALWGLWGVRPDQVIDYQALVGDPVDNVPGISLIGPKLAKQLLEQYDTLEGVLDNAEKLTGKKRKQNLMEGRETALLSRELVALRRDVESPIPWSRALRSSTDLKRLDGLIEEFGFRRLRTRANEVLGGQSVSGEEPTWETNYQTIQKREDLETLVDQLKQKSLIAIDTETTSTQPRSCDLVGISIAWQPGEAAYIAIRAPDGEPVIDESEAIESLREILESTTIQKVGHNIKFDQVVLRSARGGVELGGVTMDTMVADYLLNPGGRNHTLDDLSKRRLHHTTTSIKDLIGTGKKQITMDQVPLDQVSPYACEDVDVPVRVVQELSDELQAEGLDELYRTLEIPLINVLAEMEFNGIRVNADTLNEMSDRFEKEIADLKSIIHSLAGKQFNLDSPKQLAVVLFEELKLPVIKKTKTGISTDADVLGQLAPDHEIAKHILAYRQATKLKNTYIDALPLLISEKTGRVHTSFRQDVAATGRLSSSEPNLQNIPIRTEQGKAIRGAFQASQPDWVLLGADYSQIELRVLAHYSQDEALLRAYREDADIHTRVAAEVNEMDEADVTSDLRRVAKTINFGIVYGQSPFGLAKTLGISKGEAADYIEKYFATYRGVETFMMETLSRCRREGTVSTLLGRRREIQGVRDLENLPESKRRSLTEAERIAINMPIQGTAADLIKLAMLKVHAELAQSNLKARLLLQIHDELLLETPAEEVEELSKLVRTCMSGVMQLDVPIKVDVAYGPTWADC